MNMVFRSLSSAVSKKSSSAASVAIILRSESLIKHSDTKLSKLLDEQQDLQVCFIKRAKRIGDFWSGDVALPGGKAELNESSLDCAVREAHEEIGIDLKSFLYIGPGKEIIINRGQKNCIAISPHIFLYTLQHDNFPTFNINPDEVEYAFWFNVRNLLDRGMEGGDFLTVDIAGRYLQRFEREERMHEAYFLKLLMSITGITKAQFPSIILSHERENSHNDHLWGLTMRIILENCGRGDASLLCGPAVSFNENRVMNTIINTLHNASRGTLKTYSNIALSVSIYICVPLICTSTIMWRCL